MRKILAVLSALVFLAIPVSAEWNQEVLLESDYYLEVFGMSDDGNRIVYIADTDDNRATAWDREVFLLDLNTGEVTRITRNVDQEVQAGISGNGNVIIYGTKRGNTYSYYRVLGTYSWQNPVPLVDGNGRQFQIYATLPIGHVAMNYHGTAASLTLVRGYHSYTYLFQGYRNIQLYHGCAPAEIRGPNHRVMSGLNNQDLYYGLPGILKIFSTNPGEFIWYWYHFPQPYSVSYDGKVVFSVKSSSESARKGIFLYDRQNVFQISQKTPTHLVISGDGSRIFYFVRPSFYNNQLSVMNSDGSEDSVIATNFIRSYPKHVSLFTNHNGTKVFIWCYDFTDRKYKLIMFTEEQESLNIPAIWERWQSIGGAILPSSTTIEFGSAEGVPESEVQIPVKISNADRLGAISLLLNYPSDVLEVVDVIPGSLTQNSLMDYNVQGDNISVGIVDSEGISGNGSLLYIKFRVLEQEVNLSKEPFLPEGGEFKPEILPVENSYDLLILEATAAKVDENEVTVTTINGSFKLISEEEANKGDVNGDGRITSVDALLALQMSVGKLEPNMVADMNDDGNVKPDDALKILKLSLEQSASGIIKQMYRVGVGGMTGIGTSQAGSMVKTVG
jgi:TolB protein